MARFELVVVLLFAGALFALWADRIGVSYPALLALVGAVVALLPGVPEVNLDPELALTLVRDDGQPRFANRGLAGERHGGWLPNAPQALTAGEAFLRETEDARRHV